MIDALQREVYQLRCEVDELRAEVLAAREDFRRQSSQSTGVGADRVAALQRCHADGDSGP
jgi:hypothetical protein